MKKQMQRIIVCKNCKGKGSIFNIDPYDRDGEPVELGCCECGGSGRQKRTVIIYDELYKVDENAND